MNKSSYLLSYTLCFLLFVSCLDIDIYMEIDQTGSGLIQTQYSVDKVIAGLGTIEHRESYLIIPLSEDDFLQAAEDHNIIVNNINSIKEHNTIYIEAEIEFPSLDNLNDFLQSNNTFSLSENDDRFIFRIKIFPGLFEAKDQQGIYDSERVFSETEQQDAKDLEDINKALQLNEDIITLFNFFYADKKINMTLRAPTLVKSVNFGYLDDELDVAVFERNIVDIITAREEVTWQVEY